MRKDLENRYCPWKICAARTGTCHETVCDQFVFSMRTPFAFLAASSTRVGMQGAPDCGVDRGEASDAGDAAMGTEAAERESDRSEIEPLLRRSNARRNGGRGDMGRRRARRT